MSMESLTGLTRHTPTGTLGYASYAISNFKYALIKFELLMRYQTLNMPLIKFEAAVVL